MFIRLIPYVGPIALAVAFGMASTASLEPTSMETIVSPTAEQDTGCYELSAVGTCCGANEIWCVYGELLVICQPQQVEMDGIIYNRVDAAATGRTAEYMPFATIVCTGIFPIACSFPFNPANPCSYTENPTTRQCTTYSAVGPTNCTNLMAK